MMFGYTETEINERPGVQIPPEARDCLFFSLEPKPNTWPNQLRIQRIPQALSSWVEQQQRLSKLQGLVQQQSECHIIISYITFIQRESWKIFISQMID
jgi:hypothetical protein